MRAADPGDRPPSFRPTICENWIARGTKKGWANTDIGKHLNQFVSGRPPAPPCSGQRAPSPAAAARGSPDSRPCSLQSCPNRASKTAPCRAILTREFAGIREIARSPQSATCRALPRGPCLAPITSSCDDLTPKRRSFAASTRACANCINCGHPPRPAPGTCRASGSEGAPGSDTGELPASTVDTGSARQLSSRAPP